MASPLRLGLLASGGGSNVLALIEAASRGDLNAQIAVVIANNSNAGALAHARAHDIPARHISVKTHKDVDGALVEVLREHRVDVVALAGYMKLLGPKILAAYPERIVNVHPGPLPRFGGLGMFGMHVHQAVLDSGVDASGPTVHLVDARYDHGPSLAHRPVPVRPSDTAEELAARVLAAEHDLYWRVIQAHFVEGVSHTPSPKS